MPFDPAAPSWFLNPDWRPAEGAPAAVIDPGSLAEVGRIAETTPAEIEAALDGVAAAQAGWGRLDAKSRARALHAVATAIETADLRRCAELMTRETGKPYPDSVGELANCAGVFRYYAEMARDDAGKVAGATQPGSLQYSRMAPLGVTVHVMPCNFPVLLTCWTVAASLAAGNGCVIKPAPAGALCTLDFCKVFAALPAGLVAVLPGGAAVAEALVASDRTHGVAFTGSVPAGKAVAAAAGARLKPAVIETGGSDPFIVCASAPLEVAAAGATMAAFLLSGQVCTSAERFFVVDAVHDAFLDAFAARTRALRVGHGMGRADLGPLVSEAARARVIRLVEDAVAKGARVVTGGRIPEDAGPGWFYAPTILADCTPDMAAMREECFGPVAAVMRVRDVDQAIARANDSAFGLGASVFTRDLAEAMEASERLEAGMVWINQPLIDNDALPFGGWKASGMGRELSRAGLDAFRRAKMVILDHRPAIQDWWPPYPDDWFADSGGRTLAPGALGAA
jgi:acyl-CoA reductase-like NAD-dependent aldehyde dehydrogenase